MGDRGQVLIKDNGVYLYTHWSATELTGQVAMALAKQWRWDDPDYLTRIIFDAMTENSHGRETGNGIGTKQAGDIWRLITVDCEGKTVEVADYGKVQFKGSFEDFIKAQIGDGKQ